MSAVETAHSGLRRMIASGQLKPGQTLPSEAELCDRFGVSRSSLREAQKMLVVAGALEANPGGRTLVSHMTPKQIMSGLETVVPLLPLERFIELLPLRGLLEGYAAATAAARMSDADIEKLRSLGAELATTDPGERAQELDANFHSLVLQATEDPVIVALVEAIRKRGRDYHIFDGAEGLELKRISDEAHSEIAAAIARRDPETARFLSMQHVNLTQKWLDGLRPGPVLE